MSFSPPRGVGVDPHDLTEEAGQDNEMRRQVPAWLISLSVHIGLMLLLLAISRPLTMASSSAVLTSELDDYNPEAFNFADSTVSDAIGSGGTLSDGPQVLSASGAAGTSAKQVAAQTEEKLNEVIRPKVQLPVTGIDRKGFGTNLSATVALEGGGSGGTETADGAAGSLDRLAFEIASALKENKLLVVWLFDASLSLRERRNAIADRFENVYKQLGVLNPGADKAMKTAAISFGEKVQFMTDEPVDDIREVAKLVRSMKNDESGKENTFSAVMAAAKKYAPFRAQKRSIMMIVITDERGDDYQNIEKDIQYLRRNAMKVYCVGNAAIFGREKGYVTWKYDDGSTEDLPVDQGPETVAPERVEMPFFGVQARDLDFMSASYGPYALTRMCTETGGLYLITDQSKLTFDQIVMKNYRPDYRPIADYDGELKKNKAKFALVDTARAATMKNAPVPQLVFRADTDTALRQEATEAQRLAAEQDFKVQEIVAMLERGEKDREKLDTPRWRASYDMAMGRALAMRVRYYGYNKMVAEMKVTPKTFETKGNNRWELAPSREITSGPDVKKLEKRAMEYLTRVVDEHPGTPWAMMAERELSQPMGWAWKEGRSDYAAMDRAQAERRALQLADDAEKKKNGNKKQMEKPKVRPQL